MKKILCVLITMGIMIFSGCGNKYPKMSSENVFEVFPEVGEMIDNLYLYTPTDAEKVKPYNQYIKEALYDDFDEFKNDLKLGAYLTDDVLLGEYPKIADDDASRNKAYSNLKMEIIYHSANVDGNLYVYDTIIGYKMYRETDDACCNDGCGLIYWSFECNAKNKITGSTDGIFKSDKEKCFEIEKNGIDFTFYKEETSLGSPRKPLLKIDVLFTIDGINYRICAENLYNLK